MLLSSGQKLTLYELNKEDGGRQVKINEFIRNNGKTLFNVYSAVSKRKQGFLYEFFDDSFLERGKTGKPVLADKSLKSDFIEYRTEITSDIETLRGLNILPEITILYANPVNDENINKKACSFYIWVPFDATSNITDYITEGNDKKTVVFPEHKMDGIIHTAISLTQIMSRINAAGFRFDSLSTDDIFIRHEKKAKINKESIKPVCLDLIVSASPDVAFLGDSDLLGRILFRMITEKEYKSDFFGTIHKEISEAPLIMSSYRNSSVYVVNCIYDIIRKSVSEEYSDYSQILSDLYTLNKNFLYENTNHDVGTIRPLDSSKTTSETKIDSTIVIQNMLDSRPLYCCSPKKITSLHILTVGCGNYGQEFINQTLQHGQMDGVTLRITAVSNNPDTDKKNYLANKPALGDFVRINGSKIDDPYAELNFEPISKNGSAFSLINKSENERLIKELIRSHKDVSYIFVALGNEKLNKDIAELFAEFTSDFTNGCCVNYACQSESYKYEKAWPVCINSRSSKKIGKDLRDMALKVHLSWSKATDRPLDVIREEFESKPYEFSSSLCNAINIRYKLRSLGIEYDFKNKDSLYRAAEEFNRTVLLNSDKTNFNRLVWLEHRRWILEKAVSSWDKLPAKDYEKIIALRATKDNADCKHPCLVPSNPSSPDIWKTDVSRLDPLDRMSVNFNAALKKAAEESKRNWPEQEDLIAFAGKRIREFHIDGKKKSLAQYAYNRYVVAIKNILSESTVYAKRYTSYYNKLLSACEDLGGKEFETEISSLLKQVDTAMFPIVESAKKADYKAIDAFLVTKIPYILTVPLSPNIAMCFSAKYGNAETLNNIAANLALSTNKIYYFYYYDSDSNVSFLTRKIKLVKNYLNEKKIYCKLNFFIAVAPSCEPVRTVLEENLKSIDGIGYQVKSCNDAYNAHEQFRDYLSDKKISFYNRSVNLYNNYRQDEHLVRTLGYPWFEFSLEDNSIYAPTCSYLEYTDTSGIHITTEDLLLLSNAKDSSFHFSELFDFAKSIWKNIFSDPEHFKSHVSKWNSLCQLISKHFLKHDAWATIEINNESIITSDTSQETNASETSDKSKHQKYSYTLPATCFKTAKKITDALANEKLITDHVVVSKLSGVCEVSFTAREKVANELKKVFGDRSPDTLSNSKIIETEFVCDDKSKKNFVIFFNSLHVKDLDIPVYTKNNKQSREKNYTHILTALEKGGLIRNLVINGPNDNDGCKASFDFYSHSVKNIMKKEGELLENYIFYEAVSTGYFDDVVGGFEFFYEQAGSDEPVKNEVDCLLTKGSKTIVVEAKARISIDQDVIHKLCNVASNIGVNAKKVLVITNHSKDEYVQKTTETQFARGDKDEVIIISGREEIANIGETLVKIAEGTYIPPKDYFDI